jgi:hypothetical protein
MVMHLFPTISSPLATMISRMPPRISAQKAYLEREALGASSKDGLMGTL